MLKDKFPTKRVVAVQMWERGSVRGRERERKREREKQNHFLTFSILLWGVGVFTTSFLSRCCLGCVSWLLPLAKKTH